MTIQAIDDETRAQVDKLKKRVQGVLEENLAPDEVVQVVIRGAHGQAIVGTQSRAFVIKPGWMAGATLGAETTTFSYPTLLGVQVHKGMISGAVALQTPAHTGTKMSYWGSQKDDPSKAPNAIPVTNEWPHVKAAASNLRALIDAAHAPAPSTPAAATSDGSFTDQLEKLAALRASGALSEQEFNAAKQRLITGQAAVTLKRRS